MASIRIPLLLALTVGAAALEFTMLQRIVFHQAGGWGNAEEAFVHLVAWAAIPFGAIGLLFIAAALWHRVHCIPTIPVLGLAVAGPLFAYIGLAQYGHATPLFMLIGLVLQCLAVLVASFRTARRERNAI